MEQAAAESTVQSLTASESAFRGRISQLTQRLGEVGGKVAKMRRKSAGKVEDILIDPDGLQMHLNSTD